MEEDQNRVHSNGPPQRKKFLPVCLPRRHTESTATKSTKENVAKIRKTTFKAKTNIKINKTKISQINSDIEAGKKAGKAIGNIKKINKEEVMSPTPRKGHEKLIKKQLFKTPTRQMKNKGKANVVKIGDDVESVHSIIQSAISRLDGVIKEALELKEILENWTKEEFSKSDLQGEIINKIVHSSSGKENIEQLIPKYEQYYKFTPKANRKFISTPKSVRGKLLHSLAKQEMLLNE